MVVLEVVDAEFAGPYPQELVDDRQPLAVELVIPSDMARSSAGRQPLNGYLERTCSPHSTPAPETWPL